MKETFTRKIGPLPMWAWTAIIGTVIVGWAWWRNRQSSASQSSSGTTADASQVPQFVNQTFTSVQPPSAAPIHEQGGPVFQKDDDDDDRDRDNPTKRPVNRKHPTHHRTTVPPAGQGHVPPRRTVHKTPPGKRRG